MTTLNAHRETRADPDLRRDVIEAAEAMIRGCGYTYMSSEAVAEAVGVAQKTVLRLYPEKEDLVAEVARRYRARFKSELDALPTDDAAALNGFIELFARAAENDGLMCLCGMLATEAEGLPEAVRSEARRFFLEQNVWLGDRFESLGCGRDHALSFLSTLEGALLSAQALDEPTLVREVGAAALDAIFAARRAEATSD